MFILYAKKNQLILRQDEPVTSGSVNVYPARFEFSADWDGLTRTAVFRTEGGAAVNVLLDETGECVIPWEVLTTPGARLLAGVYGTCGEELVLPTIWADCGRVQTGAAPGEDARPPTPDVYQQIMAELAGTREQTAQDAAAAQDGAERAQAAAGEAVGAAQAAREASGAAAEARDDAERFSELAAVAANESGYFFVEVQEDGCLHYIRSDKPGTLGFTLQDGELIVNYA